MHTNNSAWKALLDNGNHAFDQQQWLHALALYQDAIHYSYENLRTAQGAISEGHIASILVCHFNIADTYIELGETGAANNQFSECFRLLEQLIVSNPNNSELQNSVIRSYSQCRIEWLDFKKKVGAGTEFPDPPELLHIRHSTHSALLH